MIVHSVTKSALCNATARWIDLIAYSKSKAKSTRKDYENLERQLAEIEKKKEWYDNERMTKQYNEVRAKLEERTSNYITEGLIMRSKVQWFEHGEKSNAYFPNLVKRRKSKTHVRKLVEKSGDELTDPQKILDRLRDYFGHIYENKSVFTESECLQFISQAKTNKLNEKERMEAEGHLTIQECYNSLKTMGSNKTPGNDGLSKEFYMSFWNELGRDMVDSLNHSFDQGQLSTTQ